MAGQEDGVQVGWSSEVLLTGPPEAAEQTRRRKIVKKLVMLIAGVMLPAILTAQLTQQWAATYYTTNNNGHDSAQAVAVDPDGNAYVAGTSDGGVGAQADYVTIKYSPDGQMLWTARYCGTSGGPDCARDIAVDASGVYVFGKSYTATGYEYATVKYSTGGEKLWVATYKITQTATMEAAGLDLDADGNVLVTGSGQGPDGSLDYATIKYGPDGTKLWERLYDGPGANSADRASAIAVDASGNICVTGYTGTGYLTVVYGADGTLLGSATYNPAGEAAVARDVAPDGSGNFVVTGYRTNGGYLTIKYEPDGDQLWLASYGSGVDTRAEAIAVGSGGDVYVTGSEYQELGLLFSTVKYNSDGARQWVARTDFNSDYYESWDRPFDIALDGSGNVYVAGSALCYIPWDGPCRGLATVKYSDEGGQLWTMAIHAGGYDDYSFTDGARVIAVDPSGDVVVTGRNDLDCVTARYSSSGSSLWTRTYNYPLASTDVGKKVAFDGSGNAYVICNPSWSGSTIIKYTRNGTEEWVRVYRGQITAFAVDATGNTYLTGGSATVKYSTTGEQLWVRYYGGPEPFYYGSVYHCGIVLDASGNVYVGGTCTYGDPWADPPDFRFYLVAVKYNGAGEEQWSGGWRAPVAPGTEYESPRDATGLAIDGSGNALVCGYYNDLDGDHSATVRFSDGQVAWAHTYDNVRAYGMAADVPGNSYVFSKAFIMKYDVTGSVCWTRTTSLSDTAVMTVGAGGLYMTGPAYRSGSHDFATDKYSTGGDLLWERFYDGGSDDHPTAIALAGNSNVYVTGRSMGTGGYNDYATVGYTPSGDLVGSIRYDGPASDDDQAWAVATGPGGRVCVTGQAVVVGHGYDAAIVMYSPPATGTDDVGVTKIIEPSGVVDTLTEEPQVTVYNYGMLTRSFDVWFEIRDSATNTVRYIQSSHVTDLGPGENCDPVFPDWVVPKHQDGRYYVCAWTDLPGDVFTQNDMATSDFVVEGKQQEPPFWTPWPDVPAGPMDKVVQQGGAMATDPMGSFVYLLKGNNTCEFYQFDPATASWSTLDSIPRLGRDNIPRAVKEGGTLAQVGCKFYATKGGNSLEFWEYDPAAEPGYRWTQKADVPAGSKGVSNGAGAVGLKHGPYSVVFLLKASETFEAYYYDVSCNDWVVRADAPGDQNKKWAEGSCVTFDGVDTVYALKGEHNEFYAYVVSDNSWLAKPGLPVGPKNKRAKGGAALCYHLGKVYCIKGSNSQEFWVFDCKADTWAQGPDVTLGPRKTRVQDGGALVYCRNSRYLFATKGNCLELWSFGRLTNVGGPMDAVSAPIPIRFSLAVSPSVTSSQARISYGIPKAGNTRLKLYDVTGRCGAVLRNGWCEPGRYTATVDAGVLARGVYILKLESETSSLTRKVVIQ
jgi:hypothetical protein